MGRELGIIDWKEAFFWEGCPLCFLLNKSLWRVEDNFLYELVNDPKIRKKIRENGGFCPSHTLQLLNFKDTLGLAIIFEDIVRNIIIPHFSKKDLSLPLNCFFCEKEKEILDLYISLLPKALEDERIYLLWKENSYAFCIPHLQLIEEKVPKALFKIIEEENKNKKRKYPEFFYGSPLWDRDYSQIFLKKLRLIRKNDL